MSGIQEGRKASIHVVILLNTHLYMTDRRFLSECMVMRPEFCRSRNLKAASISSSLTATPPLAFLGTLLPLGTLEKLTQIQISGLHTRTEDHRVHALRRRPAALASAAL